MTEPAITKEIIAKHALTDDEYARIQGILGRDPNITELGVFSVMWSEHCSYKNTKRELRKFPTTEPLVFVKAGEDRGTARPACDASAIGDGWAVAFKMEVAKSPERHRAVPGRGDRRRWDICDIFTMGARPVFSPGSLRFGPIHGDTAQHQWNRSRFAGVVSGIAHYGNCIGVPTIGGEV